MKKTQGRNWRWHGAISELLWHEPDCFNFLYFQPIIWNFISPLTTWRCPKVFPRTPDLCRMLIDVTWKKSFELSRFLCCWASFSGSLVCVVWISEKGAWCVVFLRLMCLAWTYFPPPPPQPLFYSLCLLLTSIWKTDIFRMHCLGSKGRWYLRFQNYTCFFIQLVLII